MAIEKRLDDEDLALLEIIEDPIWLGEFLRSTGEGETDVSMHAPEPWRYRDYQKQFLTDDSEFILYTGGRAIGKCQPGSARILTDKGYRTITSLLNEDAFIVYTLTPDMTIEQRRALISFDKEAPVFRVITESTYTVEATLNHPFLTPTGYTPLENIKVGDYIAVATQLPHESHRSAFQWHELRILGYIFLFSEFVAEQPILPRYTAIGKELEYIADKLLVRWYKDRKTGEYTLKHRPGPFKHPINALLDQLNLLNALKINGGARRIPDLLKLERLENIKIFLEALFAQFGELSQHKISINLFRSTIAEDIRELLLRFGIETKIKYNSADSYTLETLDERAAYRFWHTFVVPGTAVGKLRLPPASEDASDFMRYDRVMSIDQVAKSAATYAVYVYDTNNYISDNVFVHNTVVLEDKLIFEIVNRDLTFPITPESVLVTPNQAQMTPLLTKVILRFTTSKLLRDYLNNNINRTEGTMKFFMKQPGKPLIFNFRIAGSRGENNMVIIAYCHSKRS